MRPSTALLREENLTQFGTTLEFTRQALRMVLVGSSHGMYENTKHSTRDNAVIEGKRLTIAALLTLQTLLFRRCGSLLVSSGYVLGVTTAFCSEGR